MFNFSGGLLAGQHDSKKDRPPPSRPVAVTFPSLEPPSPSPTCPPSTWEPAAPSTIAAHFLSLKKPPDVGPDTLQLLNISFGLQCDFETLLPYGSNGAQSYLPPEHWLETPTQCEPPTPSPTEPPVKLLSNGRRVPDRNEFYTRAKELFFKNDDAFSTLTRKPGPDHVPPRLAHFRKFWEALDNMAYYWDNSLDEYSPPNPEAAGKADGASQDSASALPSGPKQEEGVEAVAGSTAGSGSPSSNIEEPRKKAKTEESHEIMTSATNLMGFGGGLPLAPRGAIASSKALPARTAPPKVPWAVNMQSMSEQPVDLSKGSYRGYRIGNGPEMPDQYRLDCIRAFVEPITWAFGATLAPHRRPPVLCLENIRFPVRMNSVGWRGPTDRMKARQGYMEGPIFGIQCRPDTSFGSTGNLQADSVLDAVRELGGMLLLAQERAREGKTEVRSGEGKWWTSKPRWGGGPGGEVGEALGSSDAPSEEAKPKPEEKPLIRSRLGGKERRPRPSPAELWKTLKPGNPLWDPKIEYEAIGKDRNSDWDEIFMVSSLNHHISVLKLRIHRLYIQYLTEGKLPEETPSDPNWCSPVLQRTRWFDLFNTEDRTEAMRGIWGVMAYMMRAREEKNDITMTES